MRGAGSTARGRGRQNGTRGCRYHERAEVREGQMEQRRGQCCGGEQGRRVGIKVEPQGRAERIDPEPYRSGEEQLGGPPAPIPPPPLPVVAKDGEANGCADGARRACARHRCADSRGGSRLIAMCAHRCGRSGAGGARADDNRYAEEENNLTVQGAGTCENEDQNKDRGNAQAGNEIQGTVQPPTLLAEKLDGSQGHLDGADGESVAGDADSLPGLETDSSDEEMPWPDQDEHDQAAEPSEGLSCAGRAEPTGRVTAQYEWPRAHAEGRRCVTVPYRDAFEEELTPAQGRCAEISGPNVIDPTSKEEKANERKGPALIEGKWMLVGHQRWSVTPTPPPSEHKGARNLAEENRERLEAEPRVAEGTDVPPGHRRIGDAKNPGPQREVTEGQANDATGPPIAHSDGPLGCVRYPEPFKPGLRNVLTPGYEIDGDGNDGMDRELALSIETANTIGWKPLRRRLLATRAHVVLAQETRIGGEKMNQVSQWALRKGWKMLATEATIGPKGGNSAGAAIFVRAELGMRMPPRGNNVVTEGRAVTAVVDAPGYRPTLLASVYLNHGQGMSIENRRILASLASHIEAQGERWQVVVGGDFNVEPTEIANSELHEHLGMTIVYPAGKRGTCRTRTTKRIYVFFLVSAPLATAIGDVKTIEGSNIKTTHPPASPLSRGPFQ